MAACDGIQAPVLPGDPLEDEALMEGVEDADKVLTGGV